MKRLTPTNVNVDITALSDSLIVYCMNIEEALIFLGAKPNKDYTYKDLMKWAIDMHSQDEGSSTLHWDKPLPNQYQ